LNEQGANDPERTAGITRLEVAAMRQMHAAAEQSFVDYAGDRHSVAVDRPTGEIRMAQILVALPGVATSTQALSPAQEYRHGTRIQT
jgi:hypothetical protein